MPAGMEDASKFPHITEGLLRRGYAEADVRKILGENTLRVMGDAEPRCQTDTLREGLVRGPESRHNIRRSNQTGET